MDIGSKVKFTYKNAVGLPKSGTLTLSRNIVSENIMSDEEIRERLAPQLQEISMLNLVSMGVILAARNLLKIEPKATEINVEELVEKKSDNSAAGVVIILAIIVAIICFPLLVMLGMHGKLFFKGFYAKCEGEAYKAFAKKYMFVGIALYAVVILLIAIDNIFKLYALTSPAIYVLLFGGIAYFVASLILVNKKFLPESDKINPLETLKKKFVKADKKAEDNEN